MTNKINTVTITKEFFIEILSNIQNQYIKDDKCNVAIGVIFPYDYTSGYDYSLINNTLMKILSIAFKDKGMWIDYFIWDLDFGKSYKDGCVTEKNGENCDLSDSGKLYDFLVNNNRNEK